MNNESIDQGVQVDLLLTRIPKEWTPELDAPWCSRAQALARLRREDQIRSLGADNLLARLSHQWGSPGHHYLSTGQPVPDERTFCLSASHDADVVLAGAAVDRLGVDVVSCHRKTDWIERLLVEEERDILSSLRPIARSLALSRAWAVREASLKYLGTGLLVDPRTLIVSKTTKRAHWSFTQALSCQFNDLLWEVTHCDQIIEVATADSFDGSYTFAVAFNDPRATISIDTVNICEPENPSL